MTLDLYSGKYKLELFASYAEEFQKGEFGLTIYISSKTFSQVYHLWS